MKAIIKNQAQLYAELHHYGNTLETIKSKEFWNTYKEKTNRINKPSLSLRENREFSCDYIYYSIDGYEYYLYTYLITSYDGYDSVSYICRKKVLSHVEMEEMRSLFETM
jgi:hypothetical protein